MQLRIKFRFINFTALVVAVVVHVVAVVVIFVSVVLATQKLDSS